MAFYPVLKPFEDLKDNHFVYGTNGNYPAKGKESKESRILELQEKGFIGQPILDDSATLDEIKEVLDERGVEYDPKGKKADLLALVNA